jgi:pimeloyl-ACP methyl ester carboxylesterase
MTRVRTGRIEIEYEEHGVGAPVLLIAGIGAQLVHWHRDFLAALCARGYRAIVYDHRDSGRSTHLTELGAPRVWPALALGALGLPVRAGYTLSDMAGDAVALLDHLGLERAHVFGVSMGGMIAQHLALEHPARAASLTSLMSTPGGRRYAGFAARILRAFLHPAPRTREQAIASARRFAYAHATRFFEVEEDWVDEIAAQAWERGYDPAGYARQLLAILASGSRREALPRLRVPTLVIHGTHDPVIPTRAGRATARRIPGARLVLVPGLGHELPSAVWPLVLDSFHALASAAPI